MMKNKIIKRVRNINILLLSAVLLLIIAALVFIVSNITSDASRELARLYSNEAVGKFTVYLNRNLVLIQKLSNSHTVKEWFADEDNEAKKAAAYNDIIDYADMLQNAIMYVGVHKSLNEYSIEDMPAKSFTSVDRLVYDNPLNYWYYGCINADTEYTLNIDIDRITNTRNLWINHKVMDEQDIAGVFSIGLPFEMMANDLFSHYNSTHVRGFIIDRNSTIKMDSSNSVNESSSLFSAGPLLDSVIESYRDKTAGFFDSKTESSLIRLDGGAFRYVSIAPIAGTDWLVVIFFNNRSLFSVIDLLPLIITMLSAFLLYTMIEGLFMRRIVLTPLAGLTSSISKTDPDEKEPEDIYGKERDDEIGVLARTIQKMKDSLLEASREHERLMRTDQLTNIPNRRYFDERLPIEWERAARTKTPISMLMLDLDHFKKYNDTYGHLNGDRVLQQCAKVFLSELKRPTDFVVRWGGEEFVVILPDTDSQGALYLGECIRKSIEDEPISLDDGTITKITVSIGANTIIPTKNNIPSDFIRQADDALYKAKETGRNRVCFFSSI